MLTSLLNANLVLPVFEHRTTMCRQTLESVLQTVQQRGIRLKADVPKPNTEGGFHITMLDMATLASSDGSRMLTLVQPTAGSRRWNRWSRHLLRSTTLQPAANAISKDKGAGC